VIGAAIDRLVERLDDPVELRGRIRGKRMISAGTRVAFSRTGGAPA
jgi:hypothetical protein